MRRGTRVSVLLLLPAVLLAASPWEALGQTAAGAPVGVIAGPGAPATGAGDMDSCCICLCFSTASPVLLAMALAAFASDLPAGPPLGPGALDATPDPPLRLVFHPPRLA